MKSNLFFAIQLSDAARQVVYGDARQWQGELRSSAAKWYAPEDYHITLKFLGAREPCAIDAFAGLVGEPVARSWAARRQGSVPVTIGGAGAFPSLSAPRVLWAGVEPGSLPVELAGAVETACAAIGVPPETREYKPHVTLARVRESRGDTASFAPPQGAFSGIAPYHQACIALIQTSPASEGKFGGKLRYNIVHTFDLVSAGI